MVDAIVVSSGGSEEIVPQVFGYLRRHCGLRGGGGRGGEAWQRGGSPKPLGSCTSHFKLVGRGRAQSESVSFGFGMTSHRRLSIPSILPTRSCMRRVVLHAPTPQMKRGSEGVH